MPHSSREDDLESAEIGPVDIAVRVEVERSATLPPEFVPETLGVESLTAIRKARDPLRPAAVLSLNST